jgi:hypothetical protein
MINHSRGDLFLAPRAPSLELRMDASESILENRRETAFWTATCTRMVTAIGNLYCRSFHRAISRPVNGKYRCWRCLREFGLEW